MKAADTWRCAPFFHELLQGGVYVPPSAFETWLGSDALTDNDGGREGRRSDIAGKKPLAPLNDVTWYKAGEDMPRHAWTAGQRG